MPPVRPHLASLTFALVLLALASPRASSAPGDASPRVTWTERRPVSPPCDPAGPGWYRTYGQDTRGDGRRYQGASVTLPDSAEAYQAAVHRAGSSLAQIVRGNLERVVYSYLEQWPRNPDRESNRAFAESTLSQVVRAVSGTASVWKGADCPKPDASGTVQHRAFVVVGTDLNNVIRLVWSTIEIRLTMPKRPDGRSSADAFEQTVREALGVLVEAPRSNPADVNVPERERPQESSQGEGRGSVAIRAAERDLVQDSTMAHSYAAKGRGYLTQTKPDSAVICFEKSLTLAPNSASTKINLGIAYLQLKRPRDAARTLREAVALSPVFAPARVYLGQSLLSCDSLSAALVEYEKSAELAPNNGAALRGAAFVHIKRGEYGPAVTLLRQATDADPRSADTWVILGQALTGMNNIPEAIKAVERGLELNPEHEQGRKILDLLKRIRPRAGG